MVGLLTKQGWDGFVGSGKGGTPGADGRQPGAPVGAAALLVGGRELVKRQEVDAGAVERLAAVAVGRVDLFIARDDDHYALTGTRGRELAGGQRQEAPDVGGGRARLEGQQ